MKDLDDVPAWIHVKFVVPGFHRWSGAPDHRAYLRDPHRHLFHVKVGTFVEHDEREIEFHDLLDESRRMFERSFGNIAAENRSCETMARELATQLVNRYSRGFQVEVWEDDECGATVRVYPETKKAPGG